MLTFILEFKSTVYWDVTDGRKFVINGNKIKKHYKYWHYLSVIKPCEAV
jgi:hypothetical protein